MSENPMTEGEARMVLRRICRNYYWEDETLEKAIEAVVTAHLERAGRLLEPAGS